MVGHQSEGVIPSSAQLIEIYRNKLKEQINKVRIFGENQERELKRVFVELTIVEEYDRPGETLLRDLLDSLSLEERFSFLRKLDNSRDDKKVKGTKKLEELLKEGSKTLIAGSPGAGKSVLMRYLTLQTLLSDKYDDRLPIFIELKTISQILFRELKESFENLLVENIINKAVGLDDYRPLIKKHLKELLKEGKVSIFLDGLDEIKGEPFFDKLCESINTFLKAISSNNSLIISSRPYAVGAKFDSVKEMEIAPLTPEQIKKFVNCYYPTESSTLIRQLERREQKELTRIPLLLSILISLYRKGEIVENRLDLYRLITNHLVTISDEGKKVDRKFHVSDKEGRLILELLKELAFDKLFDGNATEYSQRFFFTADEIFRKAKQFSSNVKDAYLLAKDVKSIAIIREIANQTYAFTHLTIQEYLVALALSERDNYEELICKAYFDKMLTQLEVLPMAIGLCRYPVGIYGKLRELPESLDFINLRLRIHGFVYLNYAHKASLLEQIKDISEVLFTLIKNENLPITPFQDRIFVHLSSLFPLYRDSISESLLSLLRSSDGDVCRRVADVLGRLGSEKAVDPLAEILCGFDKDVAESVIDALKNIGGEKAVKHLISILSDFEGPLCSSAAEALGKIGSETAVSALVGLLYGIDDDERFSAAEALAAIGTEKVVDAVVPALFNPNTDIRFSVVRILENIDTEKALAYLTLGLCDSEGYVRLSAATALKSIGTEKAVDFLIVTLSDSFVDVSTSAAMVLGMIGNEKAVDALINILSDNKNYRCGNVITALGKAGNESAVEVLVNILSDPNPYTRESAAEALLMIGSEEAVGALLIALSDCNKRVRFMAAAALGVIGSEKAINGLVVALSDVEKDVRKRVIESLGIIGGEKAIDAVLTALSDSDWDVRESALKTLEYISTEKAVGSLGRALFDVDEGVSKGAVTLLGNINSEKVTNALILALFKSSSGVRKSVVESLGRIGGEKVIEPLTKALSDSDGDVRKSAVTSLGEIDSGKAIESLIIALSSFDGEVSSMAAEILGWIGSEEAINPLIAILSHDSSCVRKSAVEALGRINAKKVAGFLIPILNDFDKSVRKSAVEALSKVDDEEVVGALVDVFLSDSDAEMRCGVAKVLGEIGSEKAIDALVIGLINSDKDVHKNVVLALESIAKKGSEKATNALIGVLYSSNGYICGIAAESLGKLGTEKAVNALIACLSYRYSDLAKKAINALENIASMLSIKNDEEIIVSLIAALSSPRCYVRNVGVELLGRVGSEKAIGFLTEALSDSDKSVRRSAVKALQNIKDERVIESLIVALSNSESDVRYSAAEALGKIGDEKAVSALIDALSDPDKYVRESAVKSLSDIKDERVINSLSIVLWDTSKDIHRRAAKALGRIGSEKAVGALISILSEPTSYPSYEVVESLEALDGVREKMGSKEFGKALMKLIGSDNLFIKKRAIEIVGYYMLDKEFVGVLSKLVETDSDQGVKDSAKVALSRYENKLNLFFQVTQ